MSDQHRLSPKQKLVLSTLVQRGEKTISMGGVALYLDMDVNGVSQIYGALAGKGLAEISGPSKGGATQIKATEFARKIYPSETANIAPAA